MRSWTVLAALALAPAAQAADCEAPYTLDDLLTDMALTEAALRGGDNAGAGEASVRLRANLVCAEDVIPAGMVARIYRAIGGGAFVGGDPDVGGMWLKTAAELDGGFEYAPADVPAGHPVLAGWKLAKLEAMDASDPLPMDGAGDLGPGSHFVDGRSIDSASASIERMHVYQRVGDETATWIIEGNTFPDAAFGAPPTPVNLEPDPQPHSNDPVIPEARVVKQKTWPAERVVLVGAGAAGLGVGGALYGLSAVSRGNFDASNTVADMDKYQKQTNTFAIAGASSGAVGAGLLGFGILFFVVDGDPRPTLDFRF